MKIAIIGSGISGLTCAHLLSARNDVDLYEANDYIGGHTHTVDVEAESGTYAIDTGFIVFNDWTYPNFIRLLNRLGVAWQDSSMSFSVKVEKSGLEYNGTSLNALFAQRSNLLRPSFYRMVRDILRFNAEAPRLLEEGSDATLGEYLGENGYSAQFRDHYLIPMGAAIWSASADQMEEFPIEYFVRFFRNHGMLSVDERPVWRVIRGGSRSYIEPITRPFRDRIRLGSPVQRVERRSGGAVLTYLQGGMRKEERYDHVIFASHAPQTLAMLPDATAAESAVLGAFAYQPNSVVLHTDTSVLPRRRLAWAAWNYLVPGEKRDRVAVTYDMNILQGIRSPETFNVSLNMDDRIAPEKILARFTYDHPVYNDAAFRAQKRWEEISGRNRFHYCGAYWGYGFHEDGVNSALRVCESLGERL